MDIKPTDKTIQNVLEGAFYKIPRFQRPYSWDKENVDDFWTDTVASDEADYFIGSFVLYREYPKSDTFMVVDGQQRLTTITLLLAVIRNALDSLGFKELARGIQKLIEREDINSKRRFVLGSETPYPFLQEYIQKYGPAQLPKSVGAEEEALELAFNHLKAQAAAALQSVDTDPTVPDDKKTIEKQKKLLRMRDNVLQLQLIIVELSSEDDAYLIFETLNTRGKDLGIADLVKNHLTRLLKPTTQGVDVARDKWNGIRDLFDASVADIDVNAFIYHAWLSRHAYLGKERLFKEIRKRVKAADAMEFLDSLTADAKLYRQILEPGAHSWSNQEGDIERSLRALNLFRVVQPVPMTLAILRQYYNDGLTAKQTKSVLRVMENFHVQFTAVTAQRTGGGTARMYAAAAERLTVEQNKNSRAQVIKEFVEKLRERIPSYQEFEANFSEIYFVSGSTKQKALVQYLLERMDSSLRGNAAIDYSVMTIEHIAPEKPSGTSTVSSSRVGQLGNLILLPEKVNVKIGNKSFTVKKAEYKRQGIPLGPVLSEAAKWTDTEVEARTRHMAKWAYEKVFRV